MLINRLTTAICFLLSTLFHNCTQSVSGVETTNGVAIVVATSTTIGGTAPPLSLVSMCDTGYIPFIDAGIGFITSADLDGNFQFVRRTGSFHVTIVSPLGTTAGVVIKPSAENIPSLRRVLEHPGSISGSVIYADNDTLLIYLAGTSHYQLITTNRSFNVTTVAGGVYRLKIMRLPAVPFFILHEKEVSVLPGKNTILDTVVID